MRRRLVAVAAGMSLMLAVVGCGDDADPGPGTVKIGLLVSLTGTYQSVG